MTNSIQSPKKKSLAESSSKNLSIRLHRIEEKSNLRISFGEIKNKRLSSAFDYNKYI